MNDPVTDSSAHILVTGGCGFIGSHTTLALLESGYEVIVLDTLENSAPFILERVEEISGKKPVFIQGDCRDKELLRQIFSDHPITGVIHFAAYKAVGESVEQPLRYFDNNVGSLLSLLEIMQEFSVQNFVFSSSCTVYGNTSDVPVHESSPLGEAYSPYGYTKQVGEHMIQYHGVAHPEWKSVILRYFNPIGAHPSGLIGELPIGVPANLIPFLTQTVAGLRDKLKVYGSDYDTPDGTCIRDYIHVCDLADAHVKALQSMSKQKSPVEVINLGTGKGNSVLEVIHAFEEATGEKVPYQMTSRRAGDIPVMFAAIDKAEKVLNWKCKYDLKDALQHAWEWQKNIPVS